MGSPLGGAPTDMGNFNPILTSNSLDSSHTSGAVLDSQGHRATANAPSYDITPNRDIGDSPSALNAAVYPLGGAVDHTGILLPKSVFHSNSCMHCTGFPQSFQNAKDDTPTPNVNNASITRTHGRDSCPNNHKTIFIHAR